MLFRRVPDTLVYIVTMSLLFFNATSPHPPLVAQFGLQKTTQSPAPIYSQPIDLTGNLLPSAWLDPDGSDYDAYVWDNFTLQEKATITTLTWNGVYDPAMFGAGGPVLDFNISIYPSIAAGTEPAVANPPLAAYRTGGNAQETSLGSASGGTLYAYTFTLPTPFPVSAGVKYWVQIEAFQHGTVPDWCLAAGSGGNGSHYRKSSGVGGDSLYRVAPGDAAFTLLGFLAEPSTPTIAPTITETAPPTTTPAAPPTQTVTPVPSTPMPPPPTMPCTGSAGLIVLALFLFTLKKTMTRF